MYKKMVKLTKVSALTAALNVMELNCTQEEFDIGMEERRRGTLIQNAFPMLDEHEREFIMTGITKEEWDELNSEK